MLRNTTITTTTTTTSITTATTTTTATATTTTKGRCVSFVLGVPAKDRHKLKLLMQPS